MTTIDSSSRTASTHSPPPQETSTVAPVSNSGTNLPPGPHAKPVRNAKRNAHRKRRWLPSAGALVIVGLITAGLWPKPLPVESAKVSIGTLSATVNEEGKTRIKQRFVVSAPVAGHLRRIPFKAGAEMIAGETIVAVIDPPTPAVLDARSRASAEARRDTAAANLDRARAQHRFAQLDLLRAEKLAAEKTLSEQQLEDAQWRETAAAKDMTAAESALRQADVELAEFSATATGRSTSAPIEVKAPTSGRVLRVFEESTKAIAMGTPLIEIGDPSDLEVVVEVLSRDGAAIGPGTRVLLEQWGGETPLEARVRLVEPAAFTKISALGVEEQRVNVVADILAPVEQRRSLGDKFRVEARIVVWETDKTLKAPSGALFRRGSQWAAFVINGGRAEFREVKVGQSSGTETQILEGLKEGDEVILYPGDRIQEGQRLKRIEV